MGLSGKLSQQGGVLSGTLSAGQGSLSGTLGNIGATQSLYVTENGIYVGRTGFTPVEVNVPNPSTGTRSITENGVYDVTEFASADVNVPNPSSGTLNITANGVYDVSMKASADVNVPNPSTGTKSISANGTYDVTDYASAEVNVPNPSTGTKSISTNGVYDVTDFASADVNVQPPLQSKSVTPSETAQAVSPDSGKYGLSQVEVGAIPSNYVGSAIDRRSASDLSANGATVSAPSGYYPEAVSKAVQSGSATTPATSVTSNPTISVDANGLITASHSASQSVTPTVSAGYVSAGTAGTVSTSGSATHQMATQGAQTITPTTSDQTIPAGTYLTGAQTIRGDSDLVSANILDGAEIFGVQGNSMNKNTSVPSGTGAGSADIRNGKKGWVNGVLVTGDMQELGATTYTPTRSQQTIPAGKFLVGAQTIEAIPSEYIVPSGVLQIVDNGTGIDVSQYASVDVAVPSIGGGLVHVASLSDEEVALADTDFNGWTPSTTAKVILPTAEVGTFTASNIADNDYFIRQRGFIELHYIEGTSTAKGMFSKMCAENWYTITRRPSNASNYNSQTRNANVAEACANTYILRYYNSGWVVLVSSAYGIYPSNQAPSLSSTSVASPVVTVKRMIINAKCNSTYFSTTMAGKVDQSASKFHFKYDVYRRTGGYDRATIYESLADMWNNGLS